MRALAVFALVSFVLPVAGCGGSSTSDLGGSIDAGGGSSTPVASWLPELATADCAAATACFGPTLPVFLAGADCTTRLGAEIANGDASLWQSAIDSGRLVWNPDKAQGCLDAITNGGCAALTTREQDACIAALDGTVPLGQPCTYTFECAGKAFCKADATCPGVCVARLTEGQGCKVDDDCADGLSCKGSPKVCTRGAATGDACKGGTHPDCAIGLVCYGNDDAKGVAGVCKPGDQVFVGKEGDACSFSGKEGLLCDASLACAFATLDAQGLHATCVAPVAAGAACHAAIPSMCPAGQYCNVPAPVAGSGMLVLDGTCVALPGDGQPCAKALLVTDACAPDVACDDGGTCRGLQNDGAACASDVACWSDSCQAGACAPRQACSP